MNKRVNNNVVWDKYFSSLIYYTKSVKRSKEKLFSLDLPRILQSNPQTFCKIFSPGDNTGSNRLKNENRDAESEPDCTTALSNYLSSVLPNKNVDHIPSLPCSGFEPMASIDTNI